MEANVIIPSDLKDPPKKHEVEAAWIMARHYGCSVEFLRPIDGYKIKTADIVMNGILWEMKSPIGKSKTTIGRQIERAVKQSKYIVVDGRRTALGDDLIVKRIRYELGKRRSVRKIIYLTTLSEVIEITK